MILSGKEIFNQFKKGNINILPFNEERIGPNSYNLRLDDHLLVYENDTLDMKENNKVVDIRIPNEGYILQPNKLYLGKTVEKAGSNKYVPMIEGRSSIGRLGLSIHVTAGFGDVGFYGKWTLEISCLQPIKIYPFTEICQVYFHTIEGEYDLYNGKYQGQDGPVPSRLHREFN